MVKNYRHMLVSLDFEKECEKIVEIMMKSFNVRLSKVEASRYIAWKSRNYTRTITKKDLLEIIR